MCVCTHWGLGCLRPAHMQLDWSGAGVGQPRLVPQGKFLAPGRRHALPFAHAPPVYVWLCDDIYIWVHIFNNNNNSNNTMQKIYTYCIYKTHTPLHRAGACWSRCLWVECLPGEVRLMHPVAGIPHWVVDGVTPATHPQTCPGISPHSVYQREREQELKVYIKKQEG